KEGWSGWGRASQSGPVCLDVAVGGQSNRPRRGGRPAQRGPAAPDRSRDGNTGGQPAPLPLTIASTSPCVRASPKRRGGAEPVFLPLPQAERGPGGTALSPPAT